MLVPEAALRDAKDAAGVSKQPVIHPNRDCGKRPGVQGREEQPKAPRDIGVSLGGERRWAATSSLWWLQCKGSVITNVCSAKQRLLKVNA